MMKPLVKQTWEQINIGEASIVSLVALKPPPESPLPPPPESPPLLSQVPPATRRPRADPQSSTEGYFEWRIGAAAELLPHVKP